MNRPFQRWPDAYDFTGTKGTPHEKEKNGELSWAYPVSSDRWIHTIIVAPQVELTFRFSLTGENSTGG